MEIALEQGKNAIGDYERTHDSASNTLKRAKEATTELQVAVGTALSPSVSLLGGLWATVATELAKVIKANNDLKNAIKSEGTETKDDFTSNYIKGTKIVFKPGKLMKNAVTGIEYHKIED